MNEPVVLSGLRPTGRVHLGNYFGAVKNWVDLQESGKYRCFFFVADLHALTTDYADTEALAAYTRDASWRSDVSPPGGMASTVVGSPRSAIAALSRLSARVSIWSHTT